MREVVMVDAVRSPIGRHNGSLSSVRPDDLLAEVLNGLAQRVGLDPALVDDVYAGCGNQGTRLPKRSSPGKATSSWAPASNA
jgi:acetyl-CoA acetyltransferase